MFAPPAPGGGAAPAAAAVGVGLPMICGRRRCDERQIKTFQFMIIIEGQVQGIRSFGVPYVM